MEVYLIHLDTVCDSSIQHASKFEYPPTKMDSTSLPKNGGYSPTDNSKENWSGSPQAPEVGPTHLCESNPLLLPTLSLHSFAIVSEKKLRTAGNTDRHHT